MRLRTIAIGVLALISLSGCGSADTVAPAQTATGAPAAQIPSATAEATAVLATQAPSAATEATTMPASPSPTLQDEPHQEQPSTTPSPTPPALQVTPLAPANPATLAPASIPPNSVVVATPLSPALTAMVEGARADLARRQSMALDAVELVEVRTVVWPDGGLGCPRPGMVYPQVQVDGLLIRLRVGDQTFDYHGDGVRPPFLCVKLPDGTVAPAPGADVDR